MRTLGVWRDRMVTGGDVPDEPNAPAMIRGPNVRLALTSLPENVSLVREVLSGLAAVIPLEDGQLDDVKTVVSEACNNVVLHAYDGALGRLDVEIRVSAEALEVLVCDNGGGIRPRPLADREIAGIGIPVIQALSDSVEFTGGLGEGTAVRMRFIVPGARELAAPTSAGDPDRVPAAIVLGGDVADVVVGLDGSATAGDGSAATLDVAPPSLARSVLPRPLAALAARARFSIDRLSDLQLVTDAITAHAGRSLRGSRLEVGVASPRETWSCGSDPLRPGRADAADRRHGGRRSRAADRDAG